MNAVAASVTNADNWTVASSYTDNFYFSHSGKTLGTSTSGTGSTALAWLVENIEANTNSGATANSYGDSNVGYWTLSLVSDNSGLAWTVNRYGSLGNDFADHTDYGVRPVITLSKSDISS